MMLRPSTRLLALILVASSSPAQADSYAPFRDFRQADPTGRYYVVVRKNGGPAAPGRGTPITFEIAERRAGSPPLARASDQLEDDKDVVFTPEVKVRDGDILLGKGCLERCPRRV